METTRRQHSVSTHNASAHRALGHSASAHQPSARKNATGANGTPPNSDWTKTVHADGLDAHHLGQNSLQDGVKRRYVRTKKGNDLGNPTTPALPPHELLDSLTHYRSIERMIKQLQTDFLETEELLRSAEKTNPPSGKGDSALVATITNAKRKMRQLTKEIRHLRAQARGTDRFVYSVDDGLVKEAIYLRYIKGYAWKKAGFMMGYACSDSIRKTVKRYLEKRFPSEQIPSI